MLALSSRSNLRFRSGGSAAKGERAERGADFARAEAERQIRAFADTALGLAAG